MKRIIPSSVLLVLPATCAGRRTSQIKSTCGEPTNPNASPASDSGYIHTLKPYDVMIRSATRWHEQCAEPPP